MWERAETAAADSGASRHSQKFIESADHSTEFPPAHPLLPTATIPAPSPFSFHLPQGNNSPVHGVPGQALPVTFLPTLQFTSLCLEKPQGSSQEL